LIKECKIGNKNPMFGKQVSNETRKKLSIALSGNKNPFYGKVHSEETKKHWSEIRKGRKHSAETKRKIIESRRKNDC